MPRRPPKDPLPYGIIWRHADVGDMHAGDPLAEWAYISPGFPLGLQGSRLTSIREDQQREIVSVWFKLNHTPVPPALGHGTAAHGTLALRPGQPAASWLEEEFSSLLPPTFLREPVSEFNAISRLWRPTAEPDGSRGFTANEVLELLKIAEVKFTELQRVTRGHNGEPTLVTLLDAAAEAEPSLSAGFAEVRGGVVAGLAGKPRIQQGLAFLGTGMSTLMKGYLVGVGKHLADDTYERLHTAGHAALDTLARVIAALHSLL